MLENGVDSDDPMFKTLTRKGAYWGIRTDIADYKLETEMAKTPAAVRDLLMRVWTPAREAALADAKRLEAMLHEDGINGDLAPWDWRYYAEKRRAAEHDLSEEELKPYFQLERMIEPALEVVALTATSSRNLSSSLRSSSRSRATSVSSMV